MAAFLKVYLHTTKLQTKVNTRTYKEHRTVGSTYSRLLTFSPRFGGEVPGYTSSLCWKSFEGNSSSMRVLLIEGAHLSVFRRPANDYKFNWNYKFAAAAYL